MILQKNLIFYLGIIICALTLMVSSGKVLEMDDRLIEFTAQGKWLVTFYAPWCGHCRKLEPVMDEVAKHFNEKTQMAIAKIDATRYFKAANHFEIKAYPTIKFISGKKIIDFSGERRKDDLIEFIAKADSPRVTRILNQIDFEHSKTKHKHFFLLVSTATNENAKLTKEFYELANKYFLDAYFYHASAEHVIKTIKINTQTPMVYAFKENEFFEYENNENQFLVDFIRNERFLTFTEITMSNFHNLIETRKTLLILNLNSHEKSKEKQTKKLKLTFNAFSKLNRNINHNDFQFGYVDNSDLLNGIAIWTLQTPLLFILNTTSYTYSLFDLIDEKNKAVLEIDIQEILDDIRLNKIEFIGGQSYFRTLRRPLWELYRAIIEMFFEAPFLSLLIFGFPFGVISIVFYFLCCVDSNDQEPDDEEDYESNSEDEDYYVDDLKNQNEFEEILNDENNEPQDNITKKTQ